MRYALRAPAVCCLALAFVLSALVPIAKAETPATQPASENGKILVLPFNAFNTSPNQQWLGRSIQQSLAADLTTVAPGRVAMIETSAPDTNAALDLGRKENGQYVIYGSFVTSGSDMRMTGEVLDVQAGRPIAGLKATGRSMDIFRLEDLLAMQARQRLGLGPAFAQNPMPGNAPAPEGDYGPLSVQQAPATDQYAQAYEQPPVVQNYYDTYYYGNPYAYDGLGYGYGWPFWGGVVITSPGFGRFHGHGGFRNHGGFSHGGFGHTGGFSHGGFGHVGGGFRGGIGGGFRGGMGGGHR